MAISFRELPAPIQGVAYLVLALLLFLAGEYIPGSPLNTVRVDLSNANNEVQRLNTEVQGLMVFERQSSELKAKLEALQKQLDTLKTIVPEEKEVDEFMRMLHDSSRAANVTIRRLTAKPVTPRDYHYELPFEIEVDGPYYQVLDFFGRLSRLSRIINVGDIAFSNPEDSKGKKYPVRPGTTVTGTFVATTFFTMGTTEPGGTQPGQPGGPAPVRR
jgi:Tfp pilus assembly protein PilO